MPFQGFSQVLKKAQTNKPLPMSIAHAQDEEVLRAVQEAVRQGIIEPLFVGDRNRIIEIAAQLSFDLTPFEVFHTISEEESCLRAAQLAAEGKAKAIMKGLANSTPFLKAVLHRDLKLKVKQTISHLSAFEIPHFGRVIYMTDGGLNVQPSTEQKQAIIQNAAEFLHGIGYEEPKVAILAANERTTVKMPVTVEAEEIAAFFKNETTLAGKIKIEGPLPLDLAISVESLQHKGLSSKLDGKADLLIVPTIEAGNILGKSITYFAGGTMAGIVLGAKVPLVLNSRSDSAKAKLASIAFAVLAASERKNTAHD